MKLLAPCCDTRKSCIDVAAMWGGTEKMRSLPLGEPIVSRLRERSEWRTISSTRNGAGHVESRRLHLCRDLIDNAKQGVGLHTLCAPGRRNNANIQLLPII